MKINRFDNNPIITPKDITPYHEGYEVIGAFNAGVASLKGETILLLRIAERKSIENNTITAPVYDQQMGRVNEILFDLNDESYDFSDPRLIRKKTNLTGFEYLTSLSYILIARSKDGVSFTIDTEPFIYPNDEYSEFGVEDARCTQIDSNFIITFTVVSKHGVGVRAIKTQDFIGYEDLGIVFAPENKDVLVFPEKINGKYYALHRPSLKSIGGLNIWIAESENLKYWGNHKLLLATNPIGWDEQRIGGGLPPIKTDKGWLVLYHGANNDHKYCMGAALLDIDNPSQIVARLNQPFMEPEAQYEKEGFFGDVVFGCGHVVDGDTISMYYGVSDTSMAGCSFSISELLKEME